jgi:signal transduction histidine kinase
MSALALAYLFLPPEYSFRVAVSKDVLDLTIFTAVSLALVYLIARTKQSQRDATLAKRQAEEASAGKDQVLSIVSHDLKNPLHTAALSADLISALAAQGQVARIPEHASRIRRALDRASHLVSDLLDAAKIESGALRLDPARTPIDPLLDDVVSPLAPLAETRGIVIETTFAPNQSVYVDRERVIQVLSNILTNAVQYAASGGRVRIGSTSIAGTVTFEIADTGPGMTPEQVEHAFDRFWRGRPQHGRHGARAVHRA